MKTKMDIFDLKVYELSIMEQLNIVHAS